MSKLLTIVVPIYNVEQYLHKCLDSLIVPEHMDELEILAIVDGSPDNSIQIAREFEQRYPQSIRVIDKENGGHGSCLNLGLKEATGKYWRVLDSDDWFDKTNFPIFLKKLALSSADVVQTNYVSEYMDTGKSESDNFVSDFDLTGIHQIEDLDLRKASYSFFSLHNTTYRTEILRASGIEFLERRPYDDVAFFFSPIKVVETVEFIDLDIYHYLLGREGQTVTNLTPQKIEALEQVYKFYIEDFVRTSSRLSPHKRTYIEYLIKEILSPSLYFSAKKVSNQLYLEKFISWFDYLSTLKSFDITDSSEYPVYLKYKKTPMWVLRLAFCLRKRKNK